jgi:hypothetical protein
MRWLKFLSRLAFICGIFFLLAVSLLVKNWVKEGSIVSTIIIIGYFMGMFIVPFTLLCYLILWIGGKKPATIVPRWLIIANMLSLLFLLAYIVYTNQQNAQLAI